MNRASSIFANPWVLSLLLALPILSLAQLVAAWRSRRLLHRLGQPVTLAGLLPTPPRFRRLNTLALSLALTALLFGAAGPQWGRDPRPQVVAGRDLVVLLDMSNSMRAPDAPPTRFARSVAAVRDLLAYTRARGGHRLALVVFAGDAQIVCPLTHDYDHFRDKLEELALDHPPPGLRAKPGAKSGTRLSAGLRLAVAAQDPNFAGFRDVLLLSDGDDPLGNEDWQDGLKAIENANVPFYTVGIGDPTNGSEIAVPGREQHVTSRLNEYPLQEIARRTGGAYLPAHRELPRLAEFFRRRIESKGTSTPPGDPPPLPLPRQVWFYAAALGLFGIVGLMQLRRGHLDWLCRGLQTAARDVPPTIVAPLAGRAVVTALVLLALSASEPAPAENWERQGNAAFAEERYADAIKLYAKAEERTGEPGRIAFNAGVAYFNLGRYREAERLFRCAVESADSARRSRALYNLGTCLLHSSEGKDATRLVEAIRCFDQCLDLPAIDEPLARDARHNVELAKQLWRHVSNEAPPPESDPQAPPDPTRPPDKELSADTEPGTGQDGSRTGAGTAQPTPGRADGHKPSLTEANPGPGQGLMSPLTKEEQAQPLPPHEARDLLRRAAERIARERRALLHGEAAAPRLYPDW